MSTLVTNVSWNEFSLVASHAAALKRTTETNSKQSTLPVMSRKETERNTFYKDLCDSFLAANVPLWKLNNPKLKSILEKYTSQRTPDESTLQKNYVPVLYDETMEKVRRSIGDSYGYIMVDETTDTRGDYIANLIIGVLTSDRPGDRYLIASSHLEKTNATTVCTFINDTLTS